MTGQDVPEELLNAARGYESLFVPALFETWTKHVLEGAGVGDGLHVLDIACGTGVLARAALSRVGAEGSVTGIDPAPGMIAAARAIEPRVDWLLCGAEALAVDDAAFDCVLSQFGMMFFADRRKAVEEMHRALKPGGSLAIAVWNSVEHNPAYRDFIALLQEEVGTAAADALRLPYSLGDAREITELLEANGFADVAVATKTESACFPGTRQMVEADLRGWLPLFDIFLSETEIDQVLALSGRTLSKYAQPSGEAVFPTSAHIVTAQRR